jgi:catechol 2,3-dioxygenase-like lactoylglutathione lyase family enzyme
MARLLGPDFVSLQVRNVRASREFYTQVLGFSVDARFDTPDFVLFHTNSIPLGLSQASLDLAQAPEPGWGVSLVPAL